MAAAKEGCAAVQRAADGAGIVEADSWQQVAALLSGWACRRVWRPAWGLKRSCRRVLPHQPLACPVVPGLAVSPAGLEHAWSCCRRVIDPATLLNPRPLAHGVAQAPMKQPLDTLSCATIRVSSAACLARAAAQLGPGRAFACSPRSSVATGPKCRSWAAPHSRWIPHCLLAILECGGTVLPAGLESCHRGGTGIRSREGHTHANSVIAPRRATHRPPR